MFRTFFGNHEPILNFVFFFFFFALWCAVVYSFIPVESAPSCTESNIHTPLYQLSIIAYSEGQYGTILVRAVGSAGRCTHTRATCSHHFAWRLKKHSFPGSTFILSRPLSRLPLTCACMVVERARVCVHGARIHLR